MPTRTDAELLAALRSLLADGELRLELDSVRLDRTDSPVSVQAESTRWLYALVGLALAAAWFGGLSAFAAAAAVGVGLWFRVVRRDVARRIRRRVEAQALDDVTLWRRLWRFGGVRLVVANGTEVCAAPGGNWMQCVRDRRPAGDE